MQSKSIHSMGSRRRRRRTRTSSALATVVWPVTVVIVGVLTIILFRGIGTLMVYVFNRRASRGKTSLNGLKNFPNLVMDLWPAHRYDEAKFMRSCLGKECLSEDSSDEYLILRPPGELGKIFEEFVMNYFQMSKTETTTITIINRKSFLPEVPSSNIIRPAILPLTLSAIDASLETTGADFPAKNISATDILWVMRMLAWWHCVIDYYSQGTQVLTVSFDRMLAYPEETEKQLVAFLSLSHENQNKLHVPMEDLTKRAFHRIDQVHDVIMQMVNANVLEGEAKKLDDDIQNGFCGKDFFDESDSRVTEILDRFLRFYHDPYERKLCQKYPTSRICIEFMANYKGSMDDNYQ